jgi:hypothetical protein
VLDLDAGTENNGELASACTRTRRGGRLCVDGDWERREGGMAIEGLLGGTAQCLSTATLRAPRAASGMKGNSLLVPAEPGLSFLRGFRSCAWPLLAVEIGRIVAIASVAQCAPVEPDRFARLACRWRSVLYYCVY